MYSVIGVKLKFRIKTQNLQSLNPYILQKKVDFTTKDLQRDHPPAWELKNLKRLLKFQVLNRILGLERTANFPREKFSLKKKSSK